MSPPTSADTELSRAASSQRASSAAKVQPMDRAAPTFFARSATASRSTNTLWGAIRELSRSDRCSGTIGDLSMLRCTLRFAPE